MTKILTKPKITTFLWYDREAKDAANLYASIFKNTKINKITTMNNTPSGTAAIVDLEIMGQEFELISAGPFFKFNPSISLLVACKTKEEVEAIWEKLLPGGKTRMALGEYPFSEKYGWLEDKYGLSWQIMATGQRKITQNITPTLMFTDKVCGQAEEAINFYVSVFPQSKVGEIMRYTAGEDPDKPGTIKHAGFILEGQEFAAMDSARVHGFAFNEAVSLLVKCKNQKEIDYFWEKLSADPKAEQCGWLKDKYGVSWQIAPAVLDQMLADKDKNKVAQVTTAFLKMKKFDIAELEKAYRK